MEQHEAAQRHVDMLYDLISYILERCPRNWNDEMDLRFQGVLRSFQCYDAGKDPDPPEGWEATTELSLGRNYLIAHTSLLQKFVNAARALAILQNHLELQRELESLDAKVEQNFQNFFAEPFAKDDRY